MGILKFILNNYLEMSSKFNVNKLNILFNECLADEGKLENDILSFKQNLDLIH